MRASGRIVVRWGTRTAFSGFISLPSMPTPTLILLRFLIRGAISPLGTSSQVKPCCATQPGGSGERGQEQQEAPIPRCWCRSYPGPEEVLRCGSTDTCHGLWPNTSDLPGFISNLSSRSGVWKTSPRGKRKKIKSKQKKGTNERNSANPDVGIFQSP